MFDIEFIVQGLQLVSAALEREVMNSNTLKGLEVLAELGVLSEVDARDLADALVCYQRLVQIIRLTVGDDFEPADVSHSLRIMMARSAGVSAYEDVEPVIQSHSRKVRQIFERVIGPISGL